jgi:type IV secretion system protein VirB4
MDLTLPAVNDAKIIKREAKSSRHINIIGHYDDTTLIDKDGKLIKLFEVTGIDYVTQHQLTLDIYKQRRNSLFKMFNSNYALYAWIVRGKTVQYPEGEFTEPFAVELNNKYRAQIEHTALFHNKLYLALITKAPEGKINQLSHFLKMLSHKTNQESREAYLRKVHEELQQVSNKFMIVLNDYQIRPLGVIESSYKPLSESLSFVDFVITLDKVNVPILEANASSYLPRKRLFFNAHAGTIEIRAQNNSKRFAAMLSLKAYANHSFAGILDGVQRLPIEMIITQSFRFFDPQASRTALKNKLSDFQQVKDESISQTEQLSEALDDAASGESGFGLHHLSILCMADDQQKLNQSVADIVAAFSKMDIVCVREDIACETAFWAQLPGNFSYIPREAPISTKNLAGFISLHNDAIGKATDNFWGPAVTMLETVSGSPYYFNFHFKDVGNCLCFGTMGSGKTTLIGFLLTQSLKFGGKRIVFDKDRGLEILVRALGGLYEILKPGIPTGFNPCQLPDTPENRSFLNALFKKLLTTHNKNFDENDAELTNKVIARIYALPEQDRQFKHIAPYFGVKSKGSLRARFDEWHSDGAKAWLFDNETDQLNLNADVLGFELGAILDDPECKTPALMYLMHRVTLAIEGQRGGIFIDEGWRALEDEYFKKVINDLSRTPRKKNNFLCLATQAAEDAANTQISKTLNEAAACKIFFPNPSANKTTYMESFGLTEREYEIIKKLDNNERYFLLNFGRGKESVVVRVNLQGLEDEIAVISGRENTVKLLDQIRSEIGDNPKVWLPIFHEQKKLQ